MNNVHIIPNTLKIISFIFKDKPIRLQSTKSKLSTFYDVLNLKPGCTKKEIRNSFIKLSKLNHPDVCGSSSNDKFVRINEAYNTLMDDQKKQLYDATLSHNKIKPIYYYYPQSPNNFNWKDTYNNPSNHWLSSNITIASICLSLLFIASVIRYFGVKKSSTMRSILIDDSNEVWSFLEEQKAMKIDKTKEELIKIFENNVTKEYGQIVKK